MPAVGLTQFIVFPDPALRGKDSIVSATSQDGIHPGRGVPLTTNEGKSSVFERGNYLTDAGVVLPTDFQYLVTGSGGVFGAGLWAWHRPGVDTIEAAGEGRFGFNDARYNHSSFSPVGLGDGFSPLGSVGVYNDIICREFVYYTPVGLDRKVRVAHRHIDESWTTWTKQYCTFDGTESTGLDNGFHADLGGNSSGKGSWIGACSLQDGSMRLVFQRGADIEIYESMDGLAWTLVADDILSRYTDAQCLTTIDMRLTASGDYIRLTFMDTQGTVDVSVHLRTLVSSDRGASWKEVSIGEIWPWNWGGGIDEYSHGIAGLEDGTGSFCMWITDAGGTEEAGGPIKWSCYKATRSEGWQHQWEITIGAASGRVYRTDGCLGPDGLLYFAQIHIATQTLAGRWKNSGDPLQDTAVNLWQVDPSQLDKYANWRSLAGWNNNNCMYVTPIRLSLYRAGPYLAFHAEVMDESQGESSQTRLDWTVYERRMGWDTRPISERYVPASGLTEHGDVDYQPELPLTRVNWMAWYGRPAGATYSRSDTYWTWQQNSTATNHYTNQRLQISSPVEPISSSYNYFEMDAGTFGFNAEINSWAVNDSWGGNIAGSCVEWCMRVTAGGQQTSDAIAVKVWSTEKRGGMRGISQMSVVVRHTLTHSYLYVQELGLLQVLVSETLLATLPIDMSVGFWTFRLAFLPDAPIEGVVSSTSANVFLSARPASTNKSWVSVSTSFTVAPYITTVEFRPEQKLFWGHIDHSGNTDDESEWRWVKVMGFHDCTQTLITATNTEWGWDLPNNLRGALMTANPPLYMTTGIQSYWGGTSGFERDVLNSTPQYTFATENILTESPRLAWQSSSMTGQTITLVAATGGAERIPATMKMDEVGMFGTNFRQATIVWADDAALTTNVVTTLWDAALFDATAFRVGTVLPGSGSIQFTDAGSLITQGMFAVSPEKDKRARNYYLRFTAGTTEVGSTWQIEGTAPGPGGNTVILNLGEVSSSGLTQIPGTAAGNSFIIYSDRGVVADDAASPADAKPYMGIVIDASETTPSQKFRIGTLSGGRRFDLDVPLEWSWSDNEQPNFTRNRSRSAVQWGKVEGPTQRTIDATVVGDVSQQQRQRMRYLQRMAQYEKTPVTLVLNEQKRSDPEFVLSTFLVSGNDQNNSAWYLDSNGVWRTAGDISLSFEENV